ncbi:glycosyltransferase family 2 protein [Fibrisoma montanum]|uniref:Glycosyltransferase family 2 protein n=1 Tax=Fibrisoma montanum TaxID=2305895 RepID=A0A418MAB4_9BACT|nr:glycosyltransferase [Fibrisoma montanum]RIV23317.1 glycosyltransferase family 2 protein [Fibrisoma montanum]
MSIWADLFTYLFLLYTLVLMLIYSASAIASYRVIRQHVAETSFVDYRQILTSPLSPKISIIAPAYNEALNIVDNAMSLLALEYPNFEVVIVNDGSKDDTLQRLIDAYKLEKTALMIQQRVECKEILGVYKAQDEAVSHLTVVDKRNGGKSDALNAGINVCSGRMIACIDVDCVLERDALLRMIKPFLEETDQKVIATGGVIRLANDCVVSDGRLIQVNVPRNLIARAQVLEYMRAFLLSRVAWAKVNGLLLISGALGLFDKQTVIEAGGYSHKTVGEDMELVMRMRRMMEERRQPYAVRYIPDPLCWTEGPSGWQILGRQRNRWTRGLMDCLKFHRKVFFNPHYRIMGLVSYPFWFFYEWLAPIVESLGLIASLLLWILGVINASSFWLLLATVYSYAVCLSCFAIWVDQKTYLQYRSKRDLGRLILMAVIEPFFYHPFTVYSSIRGNIDYLRGKKGWGSMTRQGLSKPAPAPPTTPTPTN